MGHLLGILIAQEPTSFWDRLTAGLTAPKGIADFVVLSFMLFSIGVLGVLSRRNILIIFMSIELILNAANLNFIAFARYWQMTGKIGENMGHIFTIFIIVVAAAEAVIGLGIVIALYRNRRTIAIDEIDLLKW
jgi:NADH-quinone oxidoreductase subunit K